MFSSSFIPETYALDTFDLSRSGEEDPCSHVHRRSRSKVGRTICEILAQMTETVSMSEHASCPNESAAYHEAAIGQNEPVYLEQQPSLLL